MTKRRYDLFDVCKNATRTQYDVLSERHRTPTPSKRKGDASFVLSPTRDRFPAFNGSIVESLPSPAFNSRLAVCLVGSSTSLLPRTQCSRAGSNWRRGVYPHCTASCCDERASQGDRSAYSIIINVQTAGSDIRYCSDEISMVQGEE